MKSLVLLLFSLMFCCTLSSQSFEILLETDFDGNVVDGSKEKLIEEIRKGKEVRIGWQLDFNDDKEPDFDHWMDAEFITILKDDVFTQIRNINIQAPDTKTPQVKIMPGNTEWTGILGTNSLLINRYVYADKLAYEVDEEGNPIMTEELEKALARREPKTWKVATFWAVSH